MSLASGKRQQPLFALRVVTRYAVLQNLVDGKISAQEAADQLRLSRRQVLRLKKQVKTKGAGGLSHKGAGRRAPNRLAESKRQLIMSVFEQWHSRSDVSVNCAHLTDILERDHALHVSRQTVWRLLRQQGMVMPCKRVRKHRLRRERSHSEGQLLFLDGSPHPWFGRDRHSATLVLCSDDATSQALYAVLVPRENLASCLDVALKVFLKFGLPMAFYLDRASQFKTTRKRYDSETRLAPPTYWQESMARLGVRCIFAYSPQARGRGERMNGSFQGRLAAELQFRGIYQLEEANRFLNETFIPEYNRRFAVKPKNSKSVWRPLPTGINPGAILAAAREVRKVDRDNTFHFEGTHYQVLPHDKVFSFAGREIFINKGFDGSIHAEHAHWGPLQIEVTEPTAKRTAKTTRVTIRLQRAGDGLAVT